MVTRKAPDDGNEGDNPKKKHRVGDVNASTAPTIPASFNTLNNDCVINILSYLSSDDMNSFAICSRNCRDARAHESLDQTRTATIVCTRRTTAQSFCDKIQENMHIFTGNRTRLKVVGLERSRTSNEVRERIVRGLRLDEVTRLDFSLVDAHPDNPTDIDFVLMSCLIHMLPNLRELDFHNIVLSDGMLSMDLVMFAIRCRALTKVTWNDSCNSNAVSYDGLELERAENLTHLCMDGSKFDLGGAAGDDHYLLMKCMRLEHLSLKDATVQEGRRGDAAEPLPQETLIEVVRRHPPLRWLRSDLTEANVAMLQRERPEITFVSE